MKLRVPLALALSLLARSASADPDAAERPRDGEAPTRAEPEPGREGDAARSAETATRAESATRREGDAAKSAETATRPDADATKRDEEPNPPRHWYGWQIAAVDGAGLGLSLVSRVAMPYLLATLAGAPAVHFAHGHPVRGLVDLGLRVVIPTATGLIVAGPSDPAPIDVDHKLHVFATSAIVAAAVVALFDATVLADGLGRF